MFKSIALMGAAIGLVVSVSSAQAKFNPNGSKLNSLISNSLISNGLNNNGTLSALAGFAVEWVELPDGAGGDALMVPQAVAADPAAATRLGGSSE